MKLTIEKRTGKTKSEAKRIRREGNIPAALYGLGRPVELVTVKGAEYKAILRGLKQGRLSTSLFELNFNGAAHKALVKDIQYNRVNYAVEHIDFLLVSDKTPVSVNVPIEVTGASESPGIKLGGTLRQVIKTLKVTCLPSDIPQEFHLDVRDLNIAQSKRLSDIAIPAKVQPRGLMNEVAVVIAKAVATA